MKLTLIPLPTVWSVFNSIFPATHSPSAPVAPSSPVPATLLPAHEPGSPSDVCAAAGARGMGGQEAQMG